MEMLHDSNDKQLHILLYVFRQNFPLIESILGFSRGKEIEAVIQFPEIMEASRSPRASVIIF